MLSGKFGGDVPKAENLAHTQDGEKHDSLGELLSREVNKQQILQRCVHQIMIDFRKEKDNHVFQTRQDGLGGRENC